MWICWWTFWISYKLTIRIENISKKSLSAIKENQYPYELEYLMNTFVIATSIASTLRIQCEKIWTNTSLTSNIIDSPNAVQCVWQNCSFKTLSKQGSTNHSHENYLFTPAMNSCRLRYAIFTYILRRSTQQTWLHNISNMFLHLQLSRFIKSLLHNTSFSRHSCII